MYTDPGILALIFTAIAGAVFGIPFYVKRVRDKVFSWFKKKPEVLETRQDK